MVYFPSFLDVVSSMPEFKNFKIQIKLCLIFIVVAVSGNAFSKAKPYAEAQGVFINTHNISGSTYNTSLLLGLKNRKRLKSKKILTYKFEVGISKLSNKNYIQQLTYLFFGLKGKNGEYRIGRHDLPYSIVDNSMDKFFSKQSNGLISDKNASDLLGYINRFGDIGVFASFSPHSSRKNATKPITSLMLNYVKKNSYGGIALYHESGNTQIGSKFVFTYKAKYKANKFGIGFILEKCPGNSNATTTTISQGQCSLSGGDSIYNISSNYQFGKQTFSAQLAKNNKTNIRKQTVEYGRKLGHSTKAYIEFDKTGSVQQTSIGLVAKFK